MSLQPSLDWLSDPSVFAVNRLTAHSDHSYYTSLAQAQRNAAMSMRHSLNGEWYFHYTKNPQLQPQDFYQSDVDNRSWSTIRVPGHIQLQGFAQPHYVNTMYPWDGKADIRPPAIPQDENGVGSYVTYFSVPTAWQSQPVFISFQGVETAFYLWLNGHFVGYSEDSFTPAEFELTPYLQTGENKLAVAVYQRSTGSWLEDQDFWRFSGIFRDVYLYTIPKIHLYDLGIKQQISENLQTAEILIKGQFSTHSENAKTVQIMLCNQEGTTLTTTEQQLTTTTFSVSLPVANPHLWSAESPYLYQLYIQIFDRHHKLIEVIPQPVGLRRFEMKNGVMCLNGKRIMFKGVNRHEFHHQRGRAINEQDMLADIQILKQHNINAVRTSHYPNQSRWYQLCDQYGIYLIDETNLETHGSWQKMGQVEPSWNIPGSDLRWNEIVLDRAKSMYERDKNHPSILIWSCGNESYAGEVLLNVANYFRQKDPQRLVHYEGVFHCRQFDQISDMESRMYAKPHEIEQYLQQNPQKPYISCEFSHAMGNSNGNLHKYIELEKYAQYQGGFIWDFIDQALLHKDRYGNDYLAYGGDFDDRPTDRNFCCNGLIFADRRLSPKMQEVKFLYQNIKLYPQKDKVLIKNENLFIDTQDYYFVATLRLDGEIKQSYRFDALIPAQTERLVPLHWDEDNWLENGEYCVEVSVHLKQKTLWAAADSELGFGQFIVAQTANKNPEPQITALPPLKMVVGDINVGVFGDHFSALFSRQEGSLISLKFGDNELIKTAPMPLFWRATTDNDRGTNRRFKSGYWLMASQCGRCQKMDWQRHQDGSVSVSFDYIYPIYQQLRVTVSYHIHCNGEVKVHCHYKGEAGLPDLPTFALSFRVAADYQHLRWYAFGEAENYQDRCSGAKLKIFENNVKDNYTLYTIPQECGNRTGVRWVECRQSAGGFKIEAIDKPLSCNFLPYTAFELEQAQHHYELPPIHYTVVTIAAQQMGVGGDDSWGAEVHPEYCLPADGELSFAFVIKVV
ncbi:MAG TPA: DUF4981 domain-containing protein [Gallibacterium anatis]|uniref:Beta-galactosidase n=1 Tax=Gallibacterium anatis TaxID=750 RepID=A0A921L242_9PAST|nr:DUF4981 domain-containing protein [Gallibacterium anatis]